MAAIISAITFQSPAGIFPPPRVRFAQHHTVEVCPANGSFPRITGLVSKARRGSSLGLLVCQAGSEGSSCCGGNGASGSSGGGCSSHGVDAAVAGVGKEFEALVATKTMQEFEEVYETGEMQGTISRDVVEDVIGIFPEALASASAEKFIDVDNLLAEARALSNGDFIFDADAEEIMV